MFLKNFRIKSNTAIRGSDRRKLRSDILKEFPNISQELVSEIIPSKDDMYVMKILTHSGKNVTAYTVNGSPILFQVETKLYPTVYLLWKYPDMVPVLTTWPNVFEKLSGGADLMLPGIIPGDNDNGRVKEFQKEQVCSVALLGNRAAVAVGYTAVSSTEALEQGMRGKGVIILHSYLDQLWSQGSKCEIPTIRSISETKDAEAHDVQTNIDDFGTNENFASTIDSDCVRESTDVTEEVTVEKSKSGGAGSGETLRENDEKTAKELDSETDSTVVLSLDEETSVNACSEYTDVTTEEDTTQSSSTDIMDKQLEQSFLQALCFIKIYDMPMLTSTFYKNHLLSCCPQGQTLDIKKSSYKKLTKFLQVMENRGYIEMKEQSRGVHCIENINWAHENLKAFKKENSDMITEKRQNDSEPTTVSKYEPPEIEDVYAVSGSTRTLFETCGYSKGAILTAKDVRQVVTDYIKSNELISTENKRIVKLDPVLFSVVHKKGEANFDSLPWDEVFKRTIDRMNPCHIVTFNGQSPITRKGKLEHIEVKLEQRMGNKKVTLVHNLEYYGIEPGEFSHKLQLKAASSTSVSQLPGKSNPGQQVLIQGNQIAHVARTLQDDYRIAAKYINGLDKLKQPKSKKR